MDFVGGVRGSRLQWMAGFQSQKLVGQILENTV
jgi:hypothetical protein